MKSSPRVWEGVQEGFFQSNRLISCGERPELLFMIRKYVRSSNVLL